VTWLKRIGKIGGALLLLPLVGIGVHYAVKAFTEGVPQGPAYHGKAVTEWIDELERPIKENGPGWGHVREFLEQPDRKTAKKVLEIMGPVAVPYLIEALDDERESVRHSCMFLLSALGPEGHVAIPKLAAMVREDPKGNAVWVLAGMAEPDTVALLEALDEPASQSVAAAALQAVPRIPKRGLTTLLRIAEAEATPPDSVFALLTHDSVPAETAVQVCTRCLEREDRRRLAAVTLAELHGKARVPAERVARILAETLRAEPDNEYLYALLRLAEEADPAAPEVAKLVDHPRFSYMAQMVLQNIGAAAAPYEEQFLERARSMDPERRARAIGVLGAMGPDAEDALYAVLAGLEDPALDVRRAACNALGARSHAADVVVPALERILNEDHNLSYAATQALVTLGDESPLALETVTRVMTTHPNKSVRYAALSALGGKSRPAVFMAAARDKQDHVRRLAAQLIKKYATTEAIPLLNEMLSEPAVGYVALLALLAMPEAAGSDVSQLEALRDDPERDARVRGRAAAAVLRLAGERAGAVQALASFLSADDQALRTSATRSCWILEEFPAGVLAALRTASLRDDHPASDRWFALGVLLHAGSADADDLARYLDLYARVSEGGSNPNPISDGLLKFARIASFDPVPYFEQEIAELRRPLQALLAMRRAVTEIKLERMYGEGWRGRRGGD